jgi:hypothetical protein
MNGSLAAALERWRDSLDEKCQSLEHTSKAEILLMIVDARTSNASRLKAFGTWSQRLTELQSCNDALCLLQHQNRQLERKRALATWIRAVADAHRCTRGIHHIAAKLWHVWEHSVLTKHMCLWKQLAQMCCQSSELWGKWAFIVLKNTHTSGFLRALHKLNARSSSRVLHEKVSEEPCPFSHSHTQTHTLTHSHTNAHTHFLSRFRCLPLSPPPPLSLSPPPPLLPHKRTHASAKKSKQQINKQLPVRRRWSSSTRRAPATGFPKAPRPRALRHRLFLGFHWQQSRSYRKRSKYGSRWQMDGRST